MSTDEMDIIFGYQNSGFQFTPLLDREFGNYFFIAGFIPLEFKNNKVNDKANRP
jgi:hypothetical protein